MSVIRRPTWAPYMAVWRVEELLRKVTTALSKAGVPYAVVGGNAVAAWVATIDPDAIRFTKDVDLLARRGDLGEMQKALLTADLTMVEVLGVTMFVENEHPSPKRGVRIVFAGERIRPNYLHAAPSVEQRTESIADYPVVDLSALVAMKLLAFRDSDRTHIRDMIGVGLITREVESKLPPDLLERLHQIQQSPEE